MATPPPPDLLPDPIAEELFNLQYDPSEMALDYLTDVLATYGLAVTAIEPQRMVITMRSLSQDKRLVGVVRVQRLERSFAIEATLDGEQFLPATGDWAAIRKYCAELQAAHTASPKVNP